RALRSRPAAGAPTVSGSPSPGEVGEGGTARRCRRRRSAAKVGGEGRRSRAVGRARRGSPEARAGRGARRRGWAEPRGGLWGGRSGSPGARAGRGGRQSAGGAGGAGGGGGAVAEARAARGGRRGAGVGVAEGGGCNRHERGRRYGGVGSARLREEGRRRPPGGLEGLATRTARAPRKLVWGAAPAG